MNIFTYFDQKKILDGWRERIDKRFSDIPNARISHLDSLQDIPQSSDQREGDVFIFGFSDGKEGSWTQVFSHIGDRHIPVMLNGELDKDYYRRVFREQTGHVLEMLDTVQFYRDATEVIEHIHMRRAQHMGERKE